MNRFMGRDCSSCFVWIMWMLLLGMWAIWSSGCGGDSPAERLWKIETASRWVQKDERSRPEKAGLDRKLPASPDAIGWGRYGNLWIVFERHLGRIRDIVQTTDVELIRLPRDENDEPDGTLEAHVLATGVSGRGERIAVGTPQGCAAILELAPDPTWKRVPVFEEGETGLMPWVGWTPDGMLTIGTQGDCQIMAINPETGKVSWHRYESVGRYPGTSPNGRLLVLPWSEGAPAEVLIAESGKTKATLPPPPARLKRHRFYGAVSDSGRWVVQGMGYPWVTLWNTESGSTDRFPMDDKKALPKSFAFLPGREVCVVLTTRGVLLLDVPQRQQVGSWKFPDGVRSCSFVPLSDLAVSADGARIAVRAAADSAMIYVLSLHQ